MKTAAKSVHMTLKAFFDNEAASGIILIFVAILAMIVANSGLAHEYHDLFHNTLPWTPIPKLNTLHLWINDGLMAIFFFVVGLEIKREVVDGALSDPQARRLPVIAAIAGMAAPALVFMAIVMGENAPELHRGWAIPAATDIAFAMGVMGLLGSRVPASLRLFLLTVAIVDDLGAVTIIALFYTANLKLMWLIVSLGVLAVMIGLNRFRVDRWWAYALLSLLLWFTVLNSGVHATIAGVLAAFTIPMRLDSHGDSLLLRFEHALLPWNAYLVVPLFGFANAGVALAGIGLSAIFDPLPLAIAGGLVIGKQVGIFAAIAGANKLKLAPKPSGATWTQIWGVAILCGIGFTMSLFIGALAFPGYPVLIEEAKIGVLLGSLISALLGFAVLRFAKGKPDEDEAAPAAA
ncbi:Na+/H+ antiporter NhaA [Croceicoccus sediminis]|uniref:Na+/H+ antiporter NhaA n=1 Tax=Croceicoccus sediminis TaxID=2571150 RepID=UPI001F105700|nr:Na+/H+ antiporter NhaA [Croceicoccus sediminis]